MSDPTPNLALRQVHIAVNQLRKAEAAVHAAQSALRHAVKLAVVSPPKLRAHSAPDGYPLPVIVWAETSPNQGWWVDDGSVYLTAVPRVFASLGNAEEWITEMSEPIEFYQEIPDYHACCLMVEAPGDEGWAYVTDYTPFLKRLKNLRPQLVEPDV